MEPAKKIPYCCQFYMESTQVTHGSKQQYTILAWRLESEMLLGVSKAGGSELWL